MKSKLKDVRIYELEVEVRNLKTKIAELEWYKLYADQIEATNHRAHQSACEYADEQTGVIEYPYAKEELKVLWK